MTACSSEYDFESKYNQETEREKVFNEIFVETFGEPDAYHTWGFERPEVTETRANQGENYAETSTGINANANEWADKADAPHGHGGWIVPDPLTEEQKAVVAAYFQTVTPLTYTDPEWRHFFVQQVYTGGNSTVRNTTEGIKAADGTSSYTSANMNLLTVGYNEQHINNFNAGTYSGAGLNTYAGGTNSDGSVNVLDSGYTVNDFAEHHHADQIMLMVNIDDTKCMGYHCSATSQQVNNKAAIVGWETIDSWARSNYTGYTGCLDDGWDRSYVGFDLALKSREDSYAKGENGEALYATFADVPDNNNMQYVWDGTKTIKIGTGAEEPSNPDLTSKLATANLWAGTMTYEEGVYVYNHDNWGGFDFAINGENWTGYSKMVIEFAEATPADMNINIKNNGVDVRLADVAWDAAVTKLEIDLTEKARDNVSQLYINTNKGPFKFSKIELIGQATTVEYYNPSQLSLRLMDSNMNQYAGESRTITDNDLQITIDGKLCLNLKTINDLLDEGFLPVSGSALKTWAKWADSDGYYSDWIVTLNEAKRQDETPTPDYYSRRVIAEDLGTVENTDFDYNDVVFDVVQGKDNSTNAINTTLTLRAAGGTLPLRLIVVEDGYETDDKFKITDPTIEALGTNHILFNREVHEWFGVDTKVMVNTYTGKHTEYEAKTYSFTNNAVYADQVRIYVQKNGEWYEITAYVGKPAQKIAAGTDYEWLDERESIITSTRQIYNNFLKFVENQKEWGKDSYKKWYQANPKYEDEDSTGTIDTDF